MLLRGSGEPRSRDADAITTLAPAAFSNCSPTASGARAVSATFRRLTPTRPDPDRPDGTPEARGQVPRGAQRRRRPGALAIRPTTRDGGPQTNNDLPRQRGRRRRRYRRPRGLLRGVRRARQRLRIVVRGAAHAPRAPGPGRGRPRRRPGDVLHRRVSAGGILVQEDGRGVAAVVAR